jgi:hypothetical protein
MMFEKPISIPTDVMARQVGDETVLLHLGSGSYFGLDPVGTRIWHLLSEGKTPPDIRDLLVTEFEVTREQLERDIERLLLELLAQGLIGAA